MHRTYQYRLRPNRTQIKALEKALDDTRFLYNAALQERREFWERLKEKHGLEGAKKVKKRITLYDQYKSLTLIRNDPAFADYKEVSAWIQRGALVRLDRAYKAFFRRVKQGKKPGHPRFKGRNRWDSLEAAESYRVKQEGKTHRIVVKGLGAIKIHMHRPLPETMTKHCGIILRRDPKGWLLYLKIEIPDVEQKANPRTVGIDVGINHLFATGTGDFTDMPDYYRQIEKELRVRQRALARSKRGSNTRRKRKMVVQRLHMKVKNRRKDFHHKVSRELVKQYDVIVCEDLRIANMMRNRHLAKSISDRSWGAFLEKIAYKAEEAGGRLERVPSKNTSQACSACGAIVKKSLSQRVHKCACGLVLDRDVNAARNILDRAGIVLGSLSQPLGGLDSELHR